MFNEIDNLSENVILSDKIKRLMGILSFNYFEKSDYNYLNPEDAYELCINYKEMQVLVDTIYDLMLENDELLNKNVDALMEKEKEERKNKEEVVR